MKQSLLNNGGIGSSPACSKPNVIPSSQPVKPIVMFIEQKSCCILKG